MANKPRRKPPAYTLHKPSGQARVRINGKDHYLGPHNSPQSHHRYARLIAEWSAAAPKLRELEQTSALDRLTVAELTISYVEFANGYYVNPDGTPSTELGCMIDAMRPLGQLYGISLVRDFGPLALKAVREHYVTLGWSRSYINHAVSRIRRVFKWGVSNELVAPSVLQGLQTVDGLRKGRTQARESVPVAPVPPCSVDAVLSHVSRQVAAMIRLQLFTGCRPGEVVIMRACDLDMSDDIWVYSPDRHKTAWRGTNRQIYLGPKSQSIVRDFLTTCIDDYLFRPCDAVAEQRRRNSDSRKTPLNCGNRPGTNRQRKPRTLPGQQYSTVTYNRAIVRGCDIAFPPPEPLARQEGETLKAWMNRLTAEQQSDLTAWQKARRWSPNQLRHSMATEIRKQFGVEAAQVVLGHARADVTQVYAERNHQLAIEVMRKCG
ncbi:MAG: site-specific integrase [Pirellulaceae bacterium]|nr:site-specific integrase [Pirellulaceae bacterium]MDP7305040.1 site-specific integrase [Pirellulaceae bacterium]HJN09844.1 site-specific integrase [Pirellulaceae bacterium]